MSTNVIITPVAAAAGTTAAAPLLPFILAGAAVTGVGLFLAATDEQYAALRKKTREQLRDERWASMQLRTTDLDRLIRSACDVQFETKPLSREAVRLQTTSREPVWAVREPGGIRLIGHEHSIRDLAVAHTTSRAIEHLQARGYRVKTTKRRGEVQITAAGQGRRVVDVVVTGHGEATVDPQHFAGRECEGVVRDLAAAIDGTVVNFCPKPEYFNVAPVKVCGVTRG
jgi:hypothetical protein